MWLGPRPNPEAMNHVQGALAGLSLLHDEANYRHSRPTKCVEYLAHGVPVITTPLPLAEALVNESQGGAVTSSFTPREVVDQVVHTVLAWQADAGLRAELGAQGHAHVVQHHSWQADGARFVQLLERYWSSPAA
jgi:glycosyltransferase involved in cell wall biosynthesis